MKELVLLKNDEAFTTSKIIADGTGISHRYIKKQIQNNIQIFHGF